SSVTYNSETYNVTSIGYGAFTYCSSLSSITIPNSVTSIGYGAFESCSSLTFISLPDSLKSIGDFAFSNCINIDTIKVDAIIPPTITATSFNNVSRNIEFIVPEEALNAYAEHEYWREFIQGAPSNVENNESVNTEIFTQNGTLHIDGITTDYQIYTTTGRLIYSGNASTLSLPRGIYLITINGETQKIVL
ncbi:MAG: leucine-rich repeat domain-containing protein, partial [Paludibacteraceae bacterium]|nr:leucine-rich repeat domain-containing protein [Paludibacteraceae bacterium]